MSRAGWCLFVLAVASLAFVSTSSALTPSQVARCLDSTGHSGLSTSSILSGLDLTRDQKRELQVRLLAFDKGFAVDLSGLDLTSDEIATIGKRLAAVSAERAAHGLGWPCQPFEHPASVVSFVRKRLVYNGFRPAMWIEVVSPRQVGFRAIQDGVTYYGTVAKTGFRRITMQMTSTHSGGGTYSFGVPFVA